VPFNFDGNDIIACEVNGFVKDFNVMTKKGMWNSNVSTASNYYPVINNDNTSKDKHAFRISGDKSFLYCISGKLGANVVTGGHTTNYTLQTNEMLSFENGKNSTVFEVEFSDKNSAVVFVDLCRI
jgi:environmental stress-induced protein Ves